MVFALVQLIVKRSFTGSFSDSSWKGLRGFIVLDGKVTFLY
jgi:hypothetical protein